jgi:hypothetical protein
MDREVHKVSKRTGEASISKLRAGDFRIPDSKEQASNRPWAFLGILPVIALSDKPGFKKEHCKFELFVGGSQGHYLRLHESFEWNILKVRLS